MYESGNDGLGGYHGVYIPVHGESVSTGVCDSDSVYSCVLGSVSLSPVGEQHVLCSSCV